MEGHSLIYSLKKTIGYFSLVYVSIFGSTAAFSENIDFSVCNQFLGDSLASKYADLTSSGIKRTTVSSFANRIKSFEKVMEPETDKVSYYIIKAKESYRAKTGGWKSYTLNIKYFVDSSGRVTTVQEGGSVKDGFYGDWVGFDSNLLYEKTGDGLVCIPASRVSRDSDGRRGTYYFNLEVSRKFCPLYNALKEKYRDLHQCGFFRLKKPAIQSEWLAMSNHGFDSKDFEWVDRDKETKAPPAVEFNRLFKTCFMDYEKTLATSVPTELKEEFPNYQDLQLQATSPSSRPRSLAFHYSQTLEPICNKPFIINSINLADRYSKNRGARSIEEKKKATP